MLAGVTRRSLQHWLLCNQQNATKTRSIARCCLSSSAATTGDNSSSTPISSFSAEKMEQDKRYQSDKQIPESLMQAAPASKFNIRDDFREGRAAYLDMSATTPLDPRVFDAMAPYMVRTCTDFSQQLFAKN